MASPKTDAVTHIRAARKAVALRLAGVLITAGVDALMVDDLSDTIWAQAVDAAKILDPTWHAARNYLPSPETKKLTATIIRWRLLAEPIGDDVFGGLPS